MSVRLGVVLRWNRLLLWETPCEGGSVGSRRCWLELLLQE